MKALCQYLDGRCTQCHRSLSEGMRRTCPVYQALHPGRPPEGPIKFTGRPGKGKKGCCGGQNSEPIKVVNLDDPPPLAPSPDEE